jgi:peptidoglycan/LPS O-acetylase OafA/YrhL
VNTGNEPSGGVRLYFPALDSLRFAAFLLVFIHHTLPGTSEGYRSLPEAAAWLVAAIAASGGFGVSLFFVLSSFLITEILRREYIARGEIDLRRFYIRRVLRIWPLYFVFLAVALNILPSLFPQQAPSPTGLGTAFALFVGNWWVAFLGFGDSQVSILWSVSVEEQFYLLWPLAFPFFFKWGWARMLLLLASASWVARIVPLWVGAPRDFIWCSTLSHLDAIAAGAALALALAGRPPSLSAIQRGLLAIAIGGGWVFVGSVNSFERAITLVCFPIIVASSVGAIVLALSRPQARLSPLAKITRYLGRISFGLYVLHLVAIRVVLLFEPQGTALLAIAGLLLTIGGAAISYHFLEKPFLRMKDAFSFIETGAGFGSATSKSGVGLNRIKDQRGADVRD